MQLKTQPHLPFKFSAKKNKLFFSLLVSTTLLFATSSAWAACDSAGNITGANGAIILSVSPAGCADDGNDVANIDSLASITSAGVALTVPTPPGASPWVITNFGKIIATGSGSTGVSIQAGATGTTIDNQSGAKITGTLSGIVSAGGVIINNRGTIDTSGTPSIQPNISGTAAPQPTAIALTAGGTINNFSGGIIAGGVFGISSSGGAVAITNAGTISGGSTAINITFGNSFISNSGTIIGDVTCTGTNNTFFMNSSLSHMIGALTMSATDTQQFATFQNVTDANIGTITKMDGGGAGDDVLTFNNSTHTGSSAPGQSEMINWTNINLINGSTLTLSGNLTLSSTTTPTLNINSSTLNANDQLNTVIDASAGPVNVDNAGLINIASPTINNTLTIRGNYVGTGGEIELNTVLGNDSSPIDKLIIDGQNGGGNASGTTALNIHNIGGAGAQTTGNGILVVETINGATTDPGSFTLSAPLRAGAYDYRLFRGGLMISDAVADDWFLRSTFLAPNEPGVALSILGPELSVYGSVLPTALDIGRVTLGTLQERVGDGNTVIANNCICNNQQFANGGWVRTFAQPYRERYSSIVDPKANGTVVGAQAGLDLYRNKNANGAINLVGLYGAYANDNPDIDGTITNADATADITAHTGSVNLNALTGGAYWTHFWCNGSYFDLVAQATSYRGDADSTRTSMSLHGVGTTESAEIGYPFYFTQQLALEPQGQIMYQYARFNDSHDEFSGVDIGSSNAVTGRLGARLKYTTLMCGYLVQPYLRANLWSILSGDRNSVNYADIQSIPTNAKTNWAQLGGGVTVNITRNLGLYGFVDGLANLGSNNRSFNGMDAGVGIRAYW